MQPDAKGEFFGAERFFPKVSHRAAVNSGAQGAVKPPGTLSIRSRARNVADHQTTKGESTMRIPFIVVFCGNEKYIFYYSRGNEDELVCRMIDYAADKQHTLGWAEVRSVMRHFELLEAGKTTPADGAAG